MLGRETELVTAFRQTEDGLARLDQVEMDRLEESLEVAHRLLQHLENQQPRVAALQTEIDQLQNTCTAEESQLLANKSKELDQTTQVCLIKIYSIFKHLSIDLTFYRA